MAARVCPAPPLLLAARAESSVDGQHDVYYYRLDTPGFRAVKKAVVTR